MSPEARERSFDELARGLANGSISRGKALRLMGAALVGGVLASMPGTAEAARFTCPTGFHKCKGMSSCCVEGRACCGTKSVPACCAEGDVCCRVRTNSGTLKFCTSSAECTSQGGRVINLG